MAKKLPRIGSRLLTNDEAAEILGLHPVSLSNMRVRGYGPTYMKKGKWLRYTEEMLEEWMRSNIVVPENERVA